MAGTGSDRLRGWWGLVRLLPGREKSHTKGPLSSPYTALPALWFHAAAGKTVSFPALGDGIVLGTSCSALRAILLMQ